MVLTVWNVVLGWLEVWLRGGTGGYLVGVWGVVGWPCRARDGVLPNAKPVADAVPAKCPFCGILGVREIALSRGQFAIAVAPGRAGRRRTDPRGKPSPPCGVKQGVMACGPPWRAG